MIPSLLQIPSAVSDSKLHSVLPNNGKGDFTFDRSTGATRINKDGLIEEVGYFSNELVQNGDFSELGSELVTNGNFDNWTNNNPDGWTVVNEDANNFVSQQGTYARIVSNDTASIQIKQTIFTIGKTYKVELDAVVNDGNVEGLKLNDATAAATIGYVNSTGHHTFYFVAAGTAFVINRKGGGATDISIDNVSVKQVDPNDRWTLGTDVEYGNSFIKMNNSAALAGAQQTNVITSGVQCRVTFTVQNYVSGTVNLRHPLSQDVTANGTYVFEGAANSTKVLIRGNAVTNNFEVTNISVVEVQGDRPRLSYDITNGVVEDKPHLLLEPSATNLITFSNDYTQSSWVKHQSGTASTPIVTSNYAISPDGTRNADRVIFNLNEATDSSFSQLAASLTTSVGNVTNSVYIKSNTDSNYIMNFTKQTGANNLITVTNKWQRFEVTLNNTGTSSVFRIRLRGTESTSKYADVSIFGAQLEQQAFATSFIPTAGTTITRAAETCNNSKPSVNSTEGVFYLEAQTTFDSSKSRRISISDGTISNRIAFEFDEALENRLRVHQNSGLVEYNAPNLSVFNKIAYKFKSGDNDLWFNGSRVAGNTSTNIPSGMNVLQLQGGALGNTFYGKVKGLAVYNEALSESQLMQLTGVTASSIYSNFVTRTASFTVEALNEVKKVIDNL